jgi:ATP synthase subunit 6
MNGLLRSLLLTLAAALPVGCSFEPESGISTSELFVNQYGHLEPHAKFTPNISPNPEVNHYFTFYDVNLYQLGAVLVILVLFGLVANSFHSPRSPWVVRMFRGWCHWLRDEVVYRVMGAEEGRKYAPFFIYLFFFVAFMNLVGLVPGSVTATATVFVTGALALITFLMMVVGGMREQGVGGFWKSLLPHGLPAWLVPLMAVVEFIGLLVKPSALMIRLFANMLAGHLLIYSFVGMIFVFAKLLDGGVLSWATAAPTVGMAVFINIIEAFVVLLQAYIFTYLSVLFVQLSLHPEH